MTGDVVTGAVRSIAHQSEAELGGSGSLLVRQRKDHALLEELLSQLRTTAGTVQDEVLTRLGRLVFPHAYGEEAVLWPVLRWVLPDGEALTLRNEQEHQRINELFSELDRTPPGDPRRAELVEALVDLLHQDARDEEDLLLPRLQQALTVQQLRRLGRTWEVVRRTAPTRPHPVVSRRPPGNLVSGLPLAVLDRTRDRLDRTARRAPALAAPAAGLSRALAVVAGALEHLPPVPYGERAETHARGTTAGSSAG
jgi:hemerythrin superfamily protein